MAQTGVEPDGAEAEEVESAAAEETASAEAKGTTEDGREDAATQSGAGTGADDTSDGSGIPKQQSAEEAADSATGEGARR
ncbi:hypothetical protein BIV23_17585 [Streptomyces monashensis]|uniref:Gliding motility protein n=1 Tax=Streptomyces monashensis TaxID=1678012 RepID=A0A1S2QE11_9ACTN|nr:hypothetical protein BIV23_17585 [Streptomyces monashensis]